MQTLVFPWHLGSCMLVLVGDSFRKGQSVETQPPLLISPPSWTGRKSWALHLRDCRRGGDKAPLVRSRTPDPQLQHLKLITTQHSTVKGRPLASHTNSPPPHQRPQAQHESRGGVGGCEVGQCLARVVSVSPFSGSRKRTGTTGVGDLKAHTPRDP